MIFKPDYIVIRHGYNHSLFLGKPNEKRYNLLLCKYNPKTCVTHLCKTITKEGQTFLCEVLCKFPVSSLSDCRFPVDENIATIFSIHSHLWEIHPNGYQDCSRIPYDQSRYATPDTKNSHRTTALSEFSSK